MMVVRFWLNRDFSLRLSQKHQPEDQRGLTCCEVDFGGARWNGVANNLAFDEIDDQLSDVGGMIGYPFEVFGNEAQANGACNRASVFEHE